jgi:protein transport protein SEC24
VASDVRTYYMRAIKSFGVADTIELLYPRMIAVHAFTEDVGRPGKYGRIVFPPLMRTSHQRMELQGVYLIGKEGCLPSRAGMCLERC